MSEKSVQLCEEKKSVLEDQIKEIIDEIVQLEHDKTQADETIKVLIKMITNRKEILQTCDDHIKSEKLREVGN